MSKITIDLEDLKSYIKSLPTESEEWYDNEWELHAHGIYKYVSTIDSNLADTFKCFMNEYGKEVEAKEVLAHEVFARGTPVTTSIGIGAAPVKTEDGSWRY